MCSSLIGGVAALHKARSLAAQVEGFHKDGTQMVKGLLGLTTGKLRDMFVQVRLLRFACLDKPRCSDRSARLHPLVARSPASRRRALACLDK